MEVMERSSFRKRDISSESEEQGTKKDKRSSTGSFERGRLGLINEAASGMLAGRALFDPTDPKETTLELFVMRSVIALAS